MPATLDNKYPSVLTEPKMAQDKGKIQQQAGTLNWWHYKMVVSESEVPDSPLTQPNIL